MPGFLKYTPEALSKALQRNARPTETQFLPAPYPFWTRHAAFTGMTWLDFDPSALSRVDVRINLDESDVKFDRTPLLLAWLRDANDDLSYSDETPIYRFPCVRDERESFNNGFFTDNTTLYFVRHSGDVYGSSGTKRVYIKFYVFNDDAYLNPDNRSWVNVIF
jgi:hypothetical protein